MPNFSERSNELELLDSEHIPVSDLYLNLRELNTINTYLGGHAVTCKALNSFELNKEITYTILDIGCGGGDNLISLAKWARKKGISLQLIGVDLKQDCISFAQKQCANCTSTNPTKVTSTLAKSNVRQRWNVRIALTSKLI